MELFMPELEQARHELVESLVAHPFLLACRTGTAPLSSLRAFLLQQGHYSRHFTRYLCAVMSNLPSGEQVAMLADNLFEELGLQGGQHIPHSKLYRNMLARFELDLDVGPAPLPETENLIRTMSEHCRDPNVAKGLGALCLGAEALVPSLYSDIVAGFRAHGFSDQDVDFFVLHIECDDGHAETMRDIMVELVQRDPAQLRSIVEAGRNLVEARCQLLSAVWAQRHVAHDSLANEHATV